VCICFAEIFSTALLSSGLRIVLRRIDTTSWWS